MKRSTKNPAPKKTKAAPKDAAKKRKPYDASVGHETPAASTKPPREPKPARERDPRLPAVGATITEEWHGKEQVVKCLADGFEFRGEHYRTLSAVAKVVTGAKSINGYMHFGLVQRPAPAAEKTSNAKAEASDAPAATGEAK